MRTDKLTSTFQQALADAQSMALSHNHSVIEPVHLLKAMLEQSNSSVASLIHQAGCQVAQLKSKLEERLNQLPQVDGAAGDIRVSNDLAKLLNRADQLAQQQAQLQRAALI